MLFCEILHRPVGRELRLPVRVALLAVVFYFAADFLKRFGSLKSVSSLNFTQRTGKPTPLVGIGVLLVMGDAITIHGENVRKWCI